MVSKSTMYRTLIKAAVLAWIGARKAGQQLELVLGPLVSASGEVLEDAGHQCDQCSVWCKTMEAKGYELCTILQFLSIALYLYLTRSYLHEGYIDILYIFMHSLYCGRYSHQSPCALHSFFWKNMWAETQSEHVESLLDWRIASVCRMRSWKMEMYWQQAPVQWQFMALPILNHV